MSRPGNVDGQLGLYYDYHSNVARYPACQAYFSQHQPPTLLWRKNDLISPVPAAEAYLPAAELHLLDTRHFALEEDHALAAGLLDEFLTKHHLPAGLLVAAQERWRSGIGGAGCFLLTCSGPCC